MLFNPLNHNFTLLPGHNPAPDVKFFELKNHPDVTGETDYHRMNIYLSQDGEFVTIWHGLLESAFLLHLFQDIACDPPDYDEPLFRGYIKTAEEASAIRKSLRLGSFEPSKIEKAEGGKITCSSMLQPPSTR